MTLDNKTKKNQKKLAKLLKKWSQEPISKEEEKAFKQFEEEMKKDRFKLPE